MARLRARLSVLALSAVMAGCNVAHQDAAVRGSADWVDISYYGDVAETLPLARQHCAQYERQPVLRKAQDNHAIYDCVKPRQTS